MPNEPGPEFTSRFLLQVLLSCGGPDGSYLVAAQARRKLGMNNTIFCLRIPSIGVLLHPKHPDTTFFTSSKFFFLNSHKILNICKYVICIYSGVQVMILFANCTIDWIIWHGGRAGKANAQYAKKGKWQIHIWTYGQCMYYILGVGHTKKIASSQNLHFF